MNRIYRYLFAGGLTTLVNLMLYTAFTRGLSWEENVANIVAVTCSVLFAYVINKMFVFRSKADSFPKLVRECASFFGARALTIFFDIGGLYILHTVLGLHDLAVKAGLTVVVVVLNYMFSRFLVFNNKGGVQDEN
jgi:putative flippase GtrA